MQHFFLIPFRFRQPQFFFLSFSATWLPQFIFSLSSILYNFGNLVATIGKSHSGTPTGALHGQCLGTRTNFDNTITEIHFFSLQVISLNFLLSHIFLTILATVLPKFSLSPHFAKKTLNSAYNNNKLCFLSYLAKRLLAH